MLFNTITAISAVVYVIAAKRLDDTTAVHTKEIVFRAEARNCKHKLTSILIYISPTAIIGILI